MLKHRRIRPRRLLRYRGCTIQVERVVSPVVAYVEPDSVETKGGEPVVRMTTLDDRLEHATVALEDWPGNVHQDCWSGWDPSIDSTNDSHGTAIMEYADLGDTYGIRDEVYEWLEASYPDDWEHPHPECHDIVFRNHWAAMHFHIRWRGL